MQEMEKIGARRYVVVYFNADTPLGVFPNNTFFLDAHSALHPSHRRQMKVLYVCVPVLCVSYNCIMCASCCVVLQRVSAFRAAS